MSVQQCWILDGKKSTGWITEHAPSTRQLDNGEDRIAGKQDN